MRAVTVFGALVATVTTLSRRRDQRFVNWPSNTKEKLAEVRRVAVGQV